MEITGISKVRTGVKEVTTIGIRMVAIIGTGIGMINQKHNEDLMMVVLYVGVITMQLDVLN